MYHRTRRVLLPHLHNTTARFNGHFYAKESMREASVKLFDEHHEDWDEILPIFIHGNQETRQSVYPEMERIIEKTNNVIAKHNMEISKRQSKDLKRPELNKWIDDCYLLLGQAYFLKERCSAPRNSCDCHQKVQVCPDAKLGQRVVRQDFMERGDWKGQAHFGQGHRRQRCGRRALRRNVPDLRRVLHPPERIQGRGQDVEQSLEYTKKRKDRARPCSSSPNSRRNLVSPKKPSRTTKPSSRPYYEMEFYARINQALAFAPRRKSSRNP